MTTIHESGSKRHKRYLASLILFASIIAYFPAMGGGFIWDDNDYVTENPTLRDASGLRAIWIDPSATPQYYPLVHSSFWVEYQIWGLHPTGYHIVNVLIHIANALLLWRVLERFNVSVAWFAAFVFAIHPVHVESVAWITERKNVLSGFFYLSAVLCFLNFDDFAKLDTQPSRRHYGWYVAAIVCFVAAMLSKTVAATWPAALLVMIWWKRGKITFDQIVALLPMFVIGVVMGLLTVRLERDQVGAQGMDWQFSLMDRFLIAGRAIWFYAAKLMWPFELIFTYPRWNIDDRQVWQYVFPAGVLVVLVGLWAMRNRIGRGPLAAVCFFCGTLFPALGFFDVYPMVFSFVADHFQYLASIGVIVLVIATANQLIVRWTARPRRIQLAAIAVVACVLAGLTWRQGKIYEGLEPLWRDTLAKNPESFMAHENLAALLTARKQYDEAETHLAEAMRIKPEFVNSYVNLAKIREGQGRFDEAMSLYEYALELHPGFPAALNGLGAVHGMKGEYERAETILKEAIEYDPEDPKPYSNLASVYAKTERYDSAIEFYEKALSIDPKLTDTRSSLAHVLMSQQDFGRAQALLKETLTLDPENVSALLNLGVIAANEQRYKTAIYYFRDVLKYDPTHVAATYNLAAMYDAVGDVNNSARYMDAYRRLSGR